MARFYCDTNVFSNLEQQTQEMFIKLKEALDQNVSNISLFFSEAHIMDKAKADERKLQSFTFMEQYVKDNFIQYLEEKEAPWYYLETPMMAHERSEHQSPTTSYFDPIKDSDDDFTKSLKQIVMDNISKVNIALSTEISDAIIQTELLHKVLPVKDNSLNLYDLMQSVGEVSKEMQSDKLFYKGLRTFFDEQINQGNLNIANDKVDFDEAFKQTVFGKSFFEHILDSCHEYADKSRVPYFRYYTAAYLMMDMLGVSMDSIKPSSKNAFPNILNDSLHSYYGQYCDYFITQDNGLKKKSEELYKRHNSKTKFLSPEEAIGVLEQIKENTENSFSDIFDKIVYDFNNEERESIDLSYNNGRILFIQPEKEYLNLFNGMLYLRTIDNMATFILFKQDEHYLSHPNFREKELAVNKCAQFLGDDLGGRGKFIFNEEIEEIKDHRWTGRSWNHGYIRVHLGINSSLKQFTLEVGPFRISES